MKRFIIITVFIFSLPMMALAENAGKISVPISAKNEHLDEACSNVKADLFRVFKSMGVSKIQMDARVFNVKVTYDPKVTRATGECVVSWKDGKKQVNHDKYFDGKAVHDRDSGFLKNLCDGLKVGQKSMPDQSAVSTSGKKNTGGAAEGRKSGATVVTDHAQ